MQPARHGTDRVVIVTGAARGLGRAMTLGLLAAGRRVVTFDLPNSEAELASLAADAKSSGASDRILNVSGDVRSQMDCNRAIDSAIARFGALHAVVNCAALGQDFDMRGDGQPGTGKFYEVPLERWEATVDINISGPFRMTKAAVPHLIAQHWGRVVNIVTSYTTMLKYTPYGASKAMLEAATVVWANDLEATGVTVNALLPGGPADTAMVPAALVADRERLVRPDVMVGPIVWLTSDASNDVTGLRFIANEWDAASSDATNLAGVKRAGWGIDAPTVRAP